MYDHLYSCLTVLVFLIYFFVLIFHVNAVEIIRRLSGDIHVLSEIISDVFFWLLKLAAVSISETNFSC